MTYGQIRATISKLAPGLDLGLVSYWVNARYTEILDSLNWQRQEVEVALATVATEDEAKLPADCRVIEAIVDADLGPLEMVSESIIDSQEAATGEPRMWAPTFDATTPAIVRQVRWFPTPDAIYSFTLRYTREEAELTTTSTSLLPWLRPAALMEGVSADAFAFLKDWTASQRAEMRFLKLISDMQRTSSLAQPPQRIEMASRFTRHRVNRWTR